MFRFNPDFHVFLLGSLAANEYILLVHIMEKKVGTLCCVPTAAVLKTFFHILGRSGASRTPEGSGLVGHACLGDIPAEHVLYRFTVTSWH